MTSFECWSQVTDHHHNDFSNSTFFESQSKFQRNCNEEVMRKNYQKQMAESVGTANVRVDDDVPTLFE